MPELRNTELATWIAEREILSVTTWPDPMVEAMGHALSSDYVETYWLPVIGPSSILLMRRLARFLEAAPDGFPLPVAPLAAELGLSRGTGRNSPMVRTLSRLVAFDVAKVFGAHYCVRTHLPTLTARRAERLPPHLLAAHVARTGGIAA